MKKEPASPSKGKQLQFDSVTGECKECVYVDRLKLLRDQNRDIRELLSVVFNIVQKHPLGIVDHRLTTELEKLNIKTKQRDVTRAVNKLAERRLIKLDVWEQYSGIGRYRCFPREIC